MGPVGPKGEAGHALASFEALAGLPCEAAGSAGRLSIDYDAARHAVLTCVASGAGGGDVSTMKINEFSVGTSGSLGDEFVELVNTGPAEVDVGGLRLVYRAAAGTADVALATFPDGTTVAPGAFYLLGSASYAGGTPADQSFGTGLASSGGGVALRDGSGTVVDSVGYGTATNAFVEGSPVPAPPVSAPPGSSAVRLPDGHDTNDNAADFTVTVSPSPRAPNH